MQIEGVQRPSIRSNARFGPSLLLDQLDGILNHSRTPVRFGVVEAINGNIKALLRRGRGYADLRYLLLKAQRLAAMKTEFLVLRKVAWMHGVLQIPAQNPIDKWSPLPYPPALPRRATSPIISNCDEPWRLAWRSVAPWRPPSSYPPDRRHQDAAREEESE
jgi:hypothetical protein